MADPRSELDDLAPLPRGRHQLSPEEVAAHQRERILAAIPTVIAERGYGGLTVEHVIGVAGVSRSTFYVHFDNKLEATLAAHEFIFEHFLAALQVACVDQAEWPMKVSAALGAAVNFAVKRPRQAQILSTGSQNADAALAERVAISHDRLAALLAGLRPSSPHAADLPEATERFLVTGVASVLAARLRKGTEADLAALEVELVELTLIPYLGAAEAARVAGSAR
jgi:AcrR family transcriptional regulator